MSACDQEKGKIKRLLPLVRSIGRQYVCSLVRDRCGQHESSSSFHLQTQLHKAAPRDGNGPMPFQLLNWQTQGQLQYGLHGLLTNFLLQTQPHKAAPREEQRYARTAVSRLLEDLYMSSNVPGTVNKRICAELFLMPYVCM